MLCSIFDFIASLSFLYTFLNQENVLLEIFCAYLYLSKILKKSIFVSDRPVVNHSRYINHSIFIFIQNTEEINFCVR